MNMNVLVKSARRLGVIVGHHSPTIFAVTGITLGVIGAVTACKQTTKASKIVEEMKEELKVVEECPESVEKEDGTVEEYTDRDRMIDRMIVYRNTAFKFVKLYGPAVALGITSCVCILAGNRIMSNRNAALASAYTAVNGAFTEYKDRVKARFGEDVEAEIRTGLKAKKMKSVVEKEDGEKVEVEEKVFVKKNDPINNPYSCFFDESCPRFSKSAELNKVFLINTQNYLNDRLRTIGYVYLNEVYDWLGLPKTLEGSRVGWVLDEDNPNWIDFGMFNIADAKAREFVNGIERAFLLDLCPDGLVYELLKKQQNKGFKSTMKRAFCN